MPKPVTTDIAFTRQDGLVLSNLLVLRVEHTYSKTAGVKTLILPAIKAGITEWIEKTKAGKEAWDYSCEDLNIGDIASSHTTDKELLACLRRQGITGLDVVFELSDANEVSYDHVLVNSEALIGTDE
jgi:hypothetical protein